MLYIGLLSNKVQTEKKLLPTFSKNGQVENSQKREENDQRHFLAEPKQEILEMCHFQNQEEIPMESISKSFYTDSRKTILKRRYRVQN